MTVAILPESRKHWVSEMPRLPVIEVGLLLFKVILRFSHMAMMLQTLIVDDSLSAASAHVQVSLFGERPNTGVLISNKGDWEIMAAINAGGETSFPSKIPFWRLVFDQKVITEEVAQHPYAGSGTNEDPYVVTWLPHDPRNPMSFSAIKKWSITILVSFVTLAVALVSSAFSGGMGQIVVHFGVAEEVVILGVSLFVLGFAIGPLIWAPLSEIFGRRHIFTISFAFLTAFNAGAAGATNIQTLIILRFLAGCFGSSPFGNAGGTIADMFPASQRGIAISFFAAAPFLGPTIGPIIGGFLATGAGWRWVEGFLAAFSGALWLCIIFLLPETYAPVLLRRRAAKLS
jgi:multidrug resistance protein